LQFVAESWTEVRDRDGKLLSSQVNAPGSELNLEGHAPFSLVIGRVSAVRVFRGDKPIDLSSYVKSTSEVARITVE
jgi:cytoskeleton protein RodZ